MIQCFLCLKPIIGTSTLCETCSIYVARTYNLESSLNSFTSKAKENLRTKIKDKKEIQSEKITVPVLIKKSLYSCVKIDKDL